MLDPKVLTHIVTDITYLLVIANRKDEMSPPSTFLILMTKDENVQLLSCNSASTCATEVSD